MSNLFIDLPSFATDYSGFISVMHGLGGMMVVHDPSGCVGNYTNTDEPRWYHEPQPVFSTVTKELEMVIGDTEGAIARTEKEINRRKPPFVCVFGTPVPALTGCDVVSMADELQSRTNVRCFGIETDGFRFYDDGIERAMDFVYENLMTKEAERVPGRINVLGMTPLDYSIYGEKEKLIKLLEKMGFHIGAFIGMGDDFEAIANAKSADVNLVMSSSALPLARKMKMQDGIGFIIGPPCREEAFDQIFGDKKCEKVLIVGEQVIANALRDFYGKTYGRGKVDVATFFRLDKDMKAAGDVKLRNEKELKDLIANGGYTMVVGDPLFADFCTGRQVFISCPHPAVSSKLYWKDTKSYVG